MKTRLYLYAVLVLCGCAPERLANPSIPALEYSDMVRGQGTPTRATFIGKTPQVVNTADQLDQGSGKAQLRLIASYGAVANTQPAEPQARDYKGPLALGDPGTSASLWNENRGDNDLYRDSRAWKPMDLITIVVAESDEGSKQADTEVKSKSTLAAAIDNLFGYETDAKEASGNTLNPSSVLKASSQNDFKGEGKTNRKGQLKATISAMVAEVLPSGILRVEGQKIISVNNEEQVMVISGLVRPRDISSTNEVDSARIANMRIDYYGNGTVGEAQYGGWASRLLRRLWPF